MDHRPCLPPACRQWNWPCGSWCFWGGEFRRDCRSAFDRPHFSRRWLGNSRGMLGVADPRGRDLTPPNAAKPEWKNACHGHKGLLSPSFPPRSVTVKNDIKSQLLYAVLIALPFLGIRLFYTVAALATRKAYLNPVTGSLTIRVLLNFLPPIIITLVYIAVGLSTRAESVEDRKRSGSSESESSRHRRRRRNSSSRAMHGKAEV